MRIRQLLDLLFEAPIEDYQLIGDFNKRHSFQSKTDRRLVSNPRYVERIKSMFRNTEVNFNMFMVNTREAQIGSGEKDEYGQRYEPFRELGEVTMEWLQQNMPETLAQIPQGSFTGNAINILFTSNFGDERRPMTGWMLAHRTAHALASEDSGYPSRYGPMSFITALRRKLEETIRYLVQLYNTNMPTVKTQNSWDAKQPDYNAWMIVNSLLPQMGTFKSARDKNLRNSAEFIYECFAQYLLNGTIRFNTPGQPMVTRYNWGRPETRGQQYGEVETSEAETTVESLAADMEQEFSRMLHMSVGRIFLM